MYYLPQITLNKPEGKQPLLMSKVVVYLELQMTLDHTLLLISAVYNTSNTGTKVWLLKVDTDICVYCSL